MSKKSWISAGACIAFLLVTVGVSALANENNSVLEVSESVSAGDVVSVEDTAEAGVQDEIAVADISEEEQKN